MKKPTQNKIKFLVLIVTTLGLFACQQSESESDKVNAQAALASPVKVDEANSKASNLINKAKQQLEKAREVKFEWTTTAALISEAEQENLTGNFEQAIELAQRAINEANNSLAQAKLSDEHWQNQAIN